MKSVDIIKKYKCDKAERRIVQHRDVLKFDGHSKIIKDNETGFLKGSAIVAKIGVMAYLMADGTVVNELVPPETLFDEDSMKTLALKPVTNQHPDDRKVNSDNASFEQVGFTGEIIAQEDDIFLAANMVITDQWAIDSVEDGRQELSPGYEAELVFQSGEFKGQKFDAIQVARKYNHLAIVDNARGGTDIRMQLDGVDNFGFEKGVIIKDKNDNSNPNKKEYSMKYTLDGIQYDADQQVINHITTLKKDSTDAKAEAITHKTALDTKTAEYDALKVKYDELERRDTKKEIQDAVDERLALERVATIILDKIDGIEKLDNRGLKLALVEKKFPELHKKIDDKTTDTYINALLDSIVEGLSKEDQSNISAQRQLATAKVDNASVKADSSEEARKKMVEDQQDAWKPKTDK